MSQNVDGRDETLGARPVGPPPRRTRAAWLWPLLLLVVVLVVVALLLSRCGSTSTSSPSSTSAASPAGTQGSGARPTTTTPATGGSSGTGAGASGPGTITAQGATVLPLAGSSTASLAEYAGQDAVTASVTVQSVPADEGFWVGTSSSNRVWVQLTGRAGESPYTVKRGDSVTFTGQFVKNTAGFAGKVGVTGSEGKAQLDAQGCHIDAAKSSLELAS